MNAFLLDENISPVIAEQVRLKDESVQIYSVHSLRDGQFLSLGDALILATAFVDNLTLITFDLRTIMPIVRDWAEEGRPHAGVVFIDDKSIAGDDFGSLVRAVLRAWSLLRESDFTDGVMFLTRDT